MADTYIKRISSDAKGKEINEYLNYLAQRLEYILENIDEENLTDKLKNKIGG